jgi:hypothetical protein
MKHVKKLLALPLLFATAGCLGRTGGEGLLFGAIFSADMMAHATNADDREYRNRALEPNVIYVSSVSPGTVQPPIESRKAVSEPTPLAPPFEPQRARQELAAVDLAHCREAGAPRGYGHATVTLNPSGDISKVVVDEPSGMSVPAFTCIGQAIGATTVPVFRGSFVTVGTTYFVP